MQIRAERAAERFKARGRSPIVIEFAGLPKAGKTTALGQVQAFLRRCGFRVEVVVERASVCPIRDKKHANFNVWTASTTLAQILEKTQTPGRPDDPEILILDRGLLDAICWLSVMERLARIRGEDREAIERFLLIDDWRKRLSGVVLMTADPKDSLERERGYLPVEGSGGSIMNEDVLSQMRSVIGAAADRLKRHFRVFQIDTSTRGHKGKPEKTCQAVAEEILCWIEEELDEEILALSRNAVVGVFAGKRCVGPDLAETLVGQFNREGAYYPRAVVEKDFGSVQALPVVIVRNKRGDILRLKRKERDQDNSLHEKVVIWAGGHVRKEDSGSGVPVLSGAIRELNEELRLCVGPEELKLLGAVFSDVDSGTSRHVGLVFEWRAQFDDVAIALSNAEFFERLGNSLSGSFVSPEELLESHSENNKEEWSRQIVRNLLVETKPKADKELFD